MTSKFTVVTANIDWATGAKADADQIEHLIDLIETEGALLLQEAKNLIGENSLRSLLPTSKTPELLRILHNETDAAHAGTGIVTKGLPMTGKRLFLGGKTPDTLARYVARANVKTKKNYRVQTSLLSAHVPPGRSGREAQDEFLEVIAKRTHRMSKNRLPWIVGTDANMPIEQAAKILGGKAYGTGIVGFITNMTPVDHGADKYGKNKKETDHPAYWMKF